MNGENQYLEEMFGLKATVAVITGGAGAIAGALAAALLKAGAKVALWELQHNTIDEAINRLSKTVEGAKDRLFGYEIDT